MTETAAQKRQAKRAEQVADAIAAFANGSAVEPSSAPEPSPAPADEAPAVQAPETAKEKYARLIKEGVPSYKMELVSNKNGELVSVTVLNELS